MANPNLRDSIDRPFPKTPREWSNFSQEVANQTLGPGSNETITGNWAFTGTVSMSGAVTFTGAVSSTEDIDLLTAVYKVDGTQVLGAQAASIADAAGATASNPSAPTGYTPHASGVVAVTSNGATDLDTTAAALDTLIDEVVTYETAISALIIDVADIRTQLNDFLAKARTHGIIDT